MTQIFTKRESSRCQILLVEDSLADARLLELAFENTGFEVDIHHVSDASAALSVLAGDLQAFGGSKPSLILLDLNLPKLRGEEFLAEIKQHPDYCSIPVVAISGSVNRADMKSAYRLGANAYMRKPSDLDQLDDFVQTLAKFWLEVAELPDECNSEPARIASAAQS